MRSSFQSLGYHRLLDVWHTSIIRRPTDGVPVNLTVSRIPYRRLVIHPVGLAAGAAVLANRDIDLGAELGLGAAIRINRFFGGSVGAGVG